MENQAESYIVLKPIAERFSRVASEISDDEIRSLIKSEMRDQVCKIPFGAWVEDILSDWVDDHKEQITTLAAHCLADKLK